tara:strand:+ start:347 stop:868 length:522 start_codon:yes stop_codon:yes gene_type:complete
MCRPGSTGVTFVPGHALGGSPLPRRYSSVRLTNDVTAAPSPTEPVERSTSGRSLVRDGYGCTPPNERKFSMFSRVWRPIMYMSEWYAGPACGLTATRSCGRRYLAYSAVSTVLTDELDAWWPPTLMLSRLGRTLLALSIISAESQLTLRTGGARRGVCSRAGVQASWIKGKGA